MLKYIAIKSNKSITKVVFGNGSKTKVVFGIFSKMIILGFLTIPWLGPKDTEPRAPSGPKAKLGHTEPRAPSVPKVKLGHSNCVRHRVILPLVMAILSFLTIPWLGPKDTEPRATLVPKAKLGHTEPRATSVPTAKLGHSNCVSHR